MCYWVLGPRKNGVWARGKFYVSRRLCQILSSVTLRRGGFGAVWVPADSTSGSLLRLKAGRPSALRHDPLNLPG